MNKRDRSKRRVSNSFEVSENWAVSYSDLLMVLMSFFIIYFNTNTDVGKNNKILNKVILNLVAKSEVKSIDIRRDIASVDTRNRIALAFSPKSHDGSDHATKKRLEIESLVAHREENSLLKAFNQDLSTKKANDSNIVSGKSLEVDINLSKNLYDVGAFELGAKGKKELDALFSIIEEAKGDFQLIFVGHTDTVQFDNKAKNIVNNNLILSSMRAAKAVEYALLKGFDENHVFVQGLNNQPRNTRSLSVRLVER